MPFVKVRLVAPSGQRYRVEIDSDLNVETVKSQLAEQLQLSPDRKYNLQLIDSFSLSPGNEVRLVEASDQGIRDLQLEPDNE